MEKVEREIQNEATGKSPDVRTMATAVSAAISTAVILE